MNTATKLSAEDILSAKDYKTEDLEVPELGGVVTLRGLSMGARWDINERGRKDSGEVRGVDQIPFATLTIMYGIVEPKMNEDQARQLVMEKGDVVSKIVDKVWELSDVEEKDAKNV